MKNEKGFTLIELMVTVVIVAIISVAVYNAYFGSVRAWNYNKSRLEVQRVQDLTERWISRYAKQAVFINSNYTSNRSDTDGEKLYIEYIDSNGNLQKVAFGQENSGEDFLYFYDIDIDNVNKRKISDLKFESISFDYYKKSDVILEDETVPESDKFYDLITVDAKIINKEDNTAYKFSSYFNPRLVLE